MSKLTIAQIVAEAHAERMAAADRAIKESGQKRQPSEAEKAAYKKAIQSINEQIKKAEKR